MKRALALLTVLLVVTISLSPVKADVTVAVATKSEPVLVDIDETRRVDAGTVINTGNETFKATLTWIQETGELWLPVTMDPVKVTLAPGDTCEVVLVLGERHEGYIGNYTGYVDILCKPVIPPASGNPTMPAAGLPLTLVVKHLSPPDFIVYSVNLTKKRVHENELFQASATVKNIGEKRGPYQVCARVSGEPVETRGLLLEGGESRKLGFNLNVSKAGNYTFSVDGCPDHIPFQVVGLPTEDVPLYLMVAAVTALASSSTSLVIVRRKYKRRNNR